MARLLDPRSVRYSGIWRSLGSIFKRGRRRGYEAKLRLTSAYRNVFWGNPSREDQELVLADLANEAGFYRVSDAASYTDRQIWQQEGKRFLFARIFEHLSLQDTDLRALESAARRESAVDADEALRESET